LVIVFTSGGVFGASASSKVSVAPAAIGPGCVQLIGAALVHVQGALGPLLIVACGASQVSSTTIGPGTLAVPILVTTIVKAHPPLAVHLPPELAGFFAIFKFPI
jgi:hypothetical protein